MEVSEIKPTKYQILEIFKKNIQKVIELEKVNVFSLKQIANILHSNRHDWKISIDIDLEDFIYFCLNNNILKDCSLIFPKKVIRRYTKYKNPASKEEVALSLSNSTYFSHYSAVMIHDLSYNVVKNLYVSTELSTKVTNSQPLLQENIDKALKKNMRVTSRIAEYQNSYIYWLESKNYNKLGIIENNNYKYTNLERTLLDILMRPSYSGGIKEVITIFFKAKDDLSINKLYKYIKKMDPIYPYHQSLGFILEYIGLNGKLVDMIEKLGCYYDFYLDYNMDLKNCNYSKKWRVYYPNYLD
ncbi:type IV toxin-antitoxin system AbiEi family antitoxin domain-containing protein [Staphylococcus pasteuri]|uniref:type IV toxin-antitoxin system AbiEi family antitoxin domain-containing protein n=2 Tax=Bacteria TaxID=2 RepID=UPI002DBE5335|nr:hypothetical protein [Staphylococcus pasteuri]MEB6613485.1 hypothetical protein [Staphylococcus pasteuri]